MSGRQSFKDLTRDFTPARRTRIDEVKKKHRALLSLGDLRKARSGTQGDLAKELQVNQPAVSKLENRQDMTISTLRDYLAAMGGNLVIVAEFDGEEIEIVNFSDHHPAA